jgi:hypothetical protein
MQKQVNAWADKNKVETTMDFTSASLQMTGAAEAQAKSGHDMYTFFNWNVHNVADAFEPVDDVIKHPSNKTERLARPVRTSLR